MTHGSLHTRKDLLIVVDTFNFERSGGPFALKVDDHMSAQPLYLVFPVKSIFAVFYLFSFLHPRETVC